MLLLLVLFTTLVWLSLLFLFNNFLTSLDWSHGVASLASLGCRSIERTSLCIELQLRTIWIDLGTQLGWFAITTTNVGHLSTTWSCSFNFAIICTQWSNLCILWWGLLLHQVLLLLKKVLKLVFVKLIQKLLAINRHFLLATISLLLKLIWLSRSHLFTGRFTLSLFYLTLASFHTIFRLWCDKLFVWALCRRAKGWELLA